MGQTFNKFYLLSTWPCFIIVIIIVLNHNTVTFEGKKKMVKKWDTIILREVYMSNWIT